MAALQRAPPQHRNDQREHQHFLEGAGPERRKRFQLADDQRTGQSLVVVATTVVLVVAMALFFGRSIIGKALRATAMNRVGARLMGIPTELSGDVSFALAALIGAV